MSLSLVDGIIIRNQPAQQAFFREFVEKVRISSNIFALAPTFAQLLDRKRLLGRLIVIRTGKPLLIPCMVKSTCVLFFELRSERARSQNLFFFLDSWCFTRWTQSPIVILFEKLFSYSGLYTSICVSSAIKFQRGRLVVDCSQCPILTSTGLRQDSVHLKQRQPPERKSKCLSRRSYERIGDLEKSKLVEWLEETAEIQAIQFINGNKRPFSKISGYVYMDGV